MFNKNWRFLNIQKEFLNFSFCNRKLAVAFYMINEIQPKIKFQNIVQCPLKVKHYFLTLTVHSPTKSNKGKWRKCAKSDYVIEAGLIWEWNRCPGSDTRVACHGWTMHCGAGGPRFETQGGTPLFGPLPFRGDSLETKKGAWELGLNEHIWKLWGW